MPLEVSDAVGEGGGQPPPRSKTRGFFGWEQRGSGLSPALQFLLFLGPFPHPSYSSALTPEMLRVHHPVEAGGGLFGLSRDFLPHLACPAPLWDIDPVVSR